MALFTRQSHGARLVVQVLGGGASVAAVCFTSDKPKVLLADRKDLPAGERTPEQTEQQIPTLVSELCTSFLDHYSKSEHAKGPIQGVEVHLGAAFSEAATGMHTMTLQTPVVITDALISDAAKKAVEGLPKSERSIMESSVTRVHVNGYPTAKPVGKTGKSVATTVFRSTVETNFRKRLEDVLRAVIPGHEPVFRSFARDLMFVLGEHAQSPYHLVIAIEDIASHCVSLRKDEIAAHATLPFGISTVLGKMTGEGSLEETRTLVRLAAKDACSTPACEAIKAKLAAVEPLIVKTFGDAFATLSSTYRLPNTCLILAHQDLSPWLESVFSRLDFAQFTVTSQPLSVAPLHQQLRGLVVHEHSDVDTWLETAIAAAALYTKQP